MPTLAPTFLLVASVMALLSCASPESYYLLSAPAWERGRDRGEDHDFGVGVGPLLIPDYIDRDEIVFQSSPNKFEIPSGHLWAGSLQKTMLKVIATNLSRTLGTTRVRTYPWGATTELDYSVAIDVHQFHARTGGDAVLDATWRVYDEAGNRIIMQGRSDLKRPLIADGYEAVVAAESLLLKDLSDEIGSALKEADEP